MEKSSLPPNYRKWIEKKCNNCLYQKEHDDWEIVDYWCDKFEGGGGLGMVCDEHEPIIGQPYR